MAQQHTVGTHRTTVKTIGTKTIVRYHSTDVVMFDPLWITLNNGGFYTATTKLRMNQTASQFGLGYRVYQRNYEWYVDLPNGDTVRMDSRKFTFKRR